MPRNSDSVLDVKDVRNKNVFETSFRVTSRKVIIQHAMKVNKAYVLDNLGRKALENEMTLVAAAKLSKILADLSRAR